VTPATSISITPVLQHVVYTRSASGTAKFYIDSLLVQSMEILGDLNNWDASYGFGLFNEANYPTNTRTWLGDIYSVAIYTTVLTPSEIAQNYAAGSNTGTVTVAWDANIEEDLAGYKVHYGDTSRFSTTLDPDAIIRAIVEEKCGEPSSTLYDECKVAWERYCTCDEWEEDEVTCKTPTDPPDPLCSPEYFKYDTEVDVGNVTEYTVTGLVKGKLYRLAATAYDTEKNESKYSIQLDHTVHSISEIRNLRRVP